MPKTTSREIAERALAPCAWEQAFHFATGHDAHDLREFHALLAKIEPGAVERHRAHYHYWVRDVMADTKLADRLRALGEDARLAGPAFQREAASAVATRVRELEDALRAKPKPRAKSAPTRAAGPKKSARAPAKAAAKKPKRN